MGTIMPEEARVRRAIRWISDALSEEPGTPMMQLVHDAAARFDLSPKQSEELIHFYRQAREHRESGNGSAP